jgi:DNA-binding beta-propeller fold protein YncE
MGVVMLAALAGLVLPAGALGFAPLSAFGAFGSGVGQLDTPGNIAIGPEGSAYVADYENNRISVFSPMGIFERAFGEGVVDGTETLQVCTTATGCMVAKADGSAGAMDQPEDVVFGPEGDLYVVDQNNNRVDVFTPAGAFLRAFGKEVELAGTGGVCTVATGCKKGVTGGSSGALDFPQGLAFGPTGDLYVADTDDERIAVFTPAGAFLRAFGEGVNTSPGDANVCTTACQVGEPGEAAGEMDHPYDVVAGPGDLLAVTDRNNNRVDIFTPEGVFVRAFGKEVNAGPGGSDVCTTGCRKGVANGSAGAFNRPAAVAIDATGNLYVADTENNRIGEFSLSGAFVRAFGEGVVNGAEVFQVCAGGAECQAGLKGTIAGSTPEPYGVAVDCRGGIYVVEENEETEFARVERFGDVAVPPPCTQPEEAVRVSLRKFAPSNRFRLRIHLNRKRGAATATVLAPAGIAVLRGRGVRRFAKRTVPGKSMTSKACFKRVRGSCAPHQPKSAARLPIRPVGKAKRTLEETGQAKVRILVTFTPTGGTPATKHRMLTLRMSEGR